MFKFSTMCQGVNIVMMMWLIEDKQGFLTPKLLYASVYHDGDVGSSVLVRIFTTITSKSGCMITGLNGSLLSLVLWKINRNRKYDRSDWRSGTWFWRSHQTCLILMNALWTMVIIRFSGLQIFVSWDIVSMFLGLNLELMLHIHGYSCLFGYDEIEVTCRRLS